MMQGFWMLVWREERGKVLIAELSCSVHAVES
jgi:hypothetical protein